ncbi:MAG TPA: flagellar hook assembly protein FlgD [Desulfobacterales bacterium]|nr:flagellar hook assembly protein FlgD [Desulfobacterales bacterium]
MAVNAVSTLADNGAASIAAKSKSLDKDAFLRLLTTQLQNQDPLNPTDSTEFTAQLAQFSSLEQLSNVNETLNTLKLYQASINNAQAVGFIGKDIVASGNSIEMKGGQPVSCDYEIPAAAKSVVVTIYDATGNFVRDYQITALGAGQQSLTWDGRDRNGNTVADGAYTFEVQAVDQKGAKLNVTTFSKGTVTGVTFEDGITYLVTGRNKTAIGNVTRVTQAAAPAATL